MNLEELRKLKERAKRNIDLRQEAKEYRIVISMGTSGIAAGARDVMKALMDEIEKRDLDNVSISLAGSLGFDEMEPVLTVEKQGGEKVTYARLDEAKAREIVEEYIQRGRKVAKYAVGTLKPSAE